MTFKVLVSIIAAALLLGVNAAHGETEKSYILTRDCEGLLGLIENSKLAHPYREYAGSYEIVCAPFVKDVLKTRQYMELIRQAEPTANIVFVYDIRDKFQQRDLELFFLSEAGWSPMRTGFYKSVNGYANVEEGYAVAVFDAASTLHELSHLVLETGKHCGRNDDPSVWGKC